MALLFADLSRSSAIARRLDAEQMADLLEQFRDACRRTVQAHGGHVARVQGDGMLAAFGYPDGAEGAAVHAVEAAFDLTAAVSRLQIDDLPLEFRPLSVHSGVHAGLVLVVDGDIERGRFDLVGEIPNGVERLSKAAAPGEVCVSVGTLGPERANYLIAESLSVAISEGEPALPAYRLTAWRPSSPRFEARQQKGLSRFVGRAQEIRALSAFIGGSGADSPRCATISGGPGLGKSRLLFELLRESRVASAKVLRGYCDNTLGAEALQPFLQILRSAVVIDGQSIWVAGSSKGGAPAIQLDAAIRPVLMQAMGGTGNVAASPESLAPAIVSLIDAIASAGPTVIALDDWQWADDASRQILVALLALDTPLCLVLASRERDVHRLATALAPQIDLEPLPPEASDAAVVDWLPGADPFLAREIHRQAGGVPLYVEELCHAVRGGRAIEALPERAGSTAWLDLLVESRLGRVPLNVADMVRVCSVLGSVFPHWMMSEAVGVSMTDPIFKEAVESDFLSVRADGAIQFKHQLTRDAVYGTIGRQRRRTWHARVFELLRERANDGDQDTVEALAFHAAGAGRRAEHAEYAELAGDKAMAVFAFDRARRHYASVLRALHPDTALQIDDPAGWCRVAAKLGMACVFDPLALPEGVGLFERAVALAATLDDVGALARAEYWLGYICYAKGFARRAIVHCNRAAALALQAGDRRLLAQVEATLGQVLFSAGRYDSALARLDVALDSKRLQARPASGVAIGSAYALACKGALLADRGDFGRAQSCFVHARELLGGTGHPVASSVLCWIAAAHLWQGQWEEAAGVARESERIADRAGVRQLLAMSRALEGYARWRLGAGIDAYEQVREATSWIEMRQGEFVTSLNYGWLLEMAVDLDLDDAVLQPLFQRLLARARHGDRLGEAMGRRALAKRYWRQGHRQLAALMLRRAERAASVRSSLHEAAANDACRALLS